MEKVKIGVIGCGKISGAYFRASRKFPVLDMVACADLMSERAEAAAREFGIPRACSVAELLADPEIRIVVNLTIPKVHAEVALAALASGKSVYSEKPLAVTREEGGRILSLARRKKLLVGCAPDTFLGGGIQTCRKVIDDGLIGEPVAASAFMLCHGHESWHPDPGFYYQTGGGPMFDMGPYYLTALVNLIGPVRRVAGFSRMTFPERTITSQPKYGQKMKVEIPTHIAGLLEFSNGAIGTIVTSFDVWSTKLPPIEIYGTEGSLQVPDPNNFAGTVSLRRAGVDVDDWENVPLTHGFPEQNRGTGVADMAYALLSGRPHRASGELAYHVLDVMHALSDSSVDGRSLTLASTCRKPAALPVGLPAGQLDP